MDIRQHLLRSDINAAYKAWCIHAEKLLLTIPPTNGDYDNGTGRGHVAFRRLTKLPPERFASCENVWARQLGKALRRIDELLHMKHWGYRADLAWQHVRDFLRHTLCKQTHNFRPFDQDTYTIPLLNNLRAMLCIEYNSSKSTARQARVKAWTSRIQSSVQQAFKFVRNTTDPDSPPMLLNTGERTVDRNEQLKAILDQWAPIFQKYSGAQPSLQKFHDHFGQHMKKGQMECLPLTCHDLVIAARETKRSSPSLDNWKPNALMALAWWYPGIYAD